MVLHCFATDSFLPLLFGLSNHHTQRENSFSFAMCGGQRCQKVEELTGHCASNLPNKLIAKGFNEQITGLTGGLECVGAFGGVIIDELFRHHAIGVGRTV